MKRRLLKLAVFLLLGAIVNVAVAWAIVWYVSYPNRGSWRVLEVPEAQEIWNRRAPVEWSSATKIDGLEDFAVGYRRFIVERENPDDLLRGVWDVVSGWPWMSMTRTSFTSNGIESSTGRLLRPWPGGIGQTPLPLRPLWPGFAINSIFYAAMLWLLWIAPSKIRRFMRIRAHRCPACGYKIDSAPGIGPRCSECGAELSKRLRTQPT